MYRSGVDGGYTRFSKRGVTLTAEVLARQNNRKVLKRPLTKEGGYAPSWKNSHLIWSIVFVVGWWWLVVGWWCKMEKFKELSKLAHHSKLLWQTDQPELLSDQKIVAHIIQKKVSNDPCLGNNQEIEQHKNSHISQT